MIATSRKSASAPTVRRRYEFSRLQDQTLAHAYEVLIPVVSLRPDRLRVSGRTAEITPMSKRFCQPSAAGA
jgi:hypothetical protein